MKPVIHKAATRGHADHGWLNAWHTFSFAGYHDPARVHFGALRVLNDDRVEAGMGFGLHPHDNMEIITIPLEGALEHKDSMGNTGIIRAGDVQVMSAGTGVYHSEFNSSKEQPVSLLQIWVFPMQRNVTPRYDQKTFDVSERRNRLQTVVSPMGESEGLNIHQQAWFSLGSLGAGSAVEYALNRKDSGLYAFIIEGKAKVNGTLLERRDGAGFADETMINISAEEATEILLMEIPMHVS
jgi:redox-sensitive bicupin YhaK (pirin superfamily)